MLTRAVCHFPNSYRMAGNGFSAGRSNCANSVARLPSRLRNGRWFSRTSSSAMAWLASSREKNLCLRRAATIQRAPSARLLEVTLRPTFLPRVPLMKPRTLWACQDVACLISARVAPLARWTRAKTAAVLLPGRTPSGFGWVAFWGALASFLARVVFLVDWGLEGATRRAGLAHGDFVGAFGSGFSPSAWIRLQIRPAADLTLWKPFTGSTPGRLFQISAKRSGGQAEDRSVSCFWLVKGWEPVPTAASAWSGVGNAVMLLSLSIVNVFM